MGRCTHLRLAVQGAAQDTEGIEEGVMLEVAVLQRSTKSQR